MTDMKESKYQLEPREGAANSGQPRCSCFSHPNFLWRACPSSALEHVVFCFDKILLQREAVEGSKWENLKGEVKCQRGSAAGT